MSRIPLMVTRTPLKAFIIALPGSQNALNLMSSLKFRFHIDSEIVTAITPSNNGCGMLVTAHTHGFGSDVLSCIEFAISESHKAAREVALASGCEWSLILEEDALLQDNLNEIPNILDSLGESATNNIACGLHLFPEQYGVLIRSKVSNVYRVMSLPDFAVAYVLNFEALVEVCELAKSAKIQIADWPRFMKKIRWYAVKDSVILHPDISLHQNPSSTFGPRTNIKNSKSLIKRYSNSRNLLLPLFKIGKITHHTLGHNAIASEKIRSVILC